MNLPHKTHNKTNKGSEPNQQTKLVVEEIRYRGAIPDPKTLKQFAEIESSLPDRMFAEVEANGKHRRKTESTMISTGAKVQTRGQIFSFIITIASMLSTVVLRLFGDDSFSIASGIVALIFLLQIVVSKAMVFFQNHLRKKSGKQ